MMSLRSFSLNPFSGKSSDTIENSKRWTRPLFWSGFAATPVVSIPEFLRHHAHPDNAHEEQKRKNQIKYAGIGLAQLASSLGMVWALHSADDSLTKDPILREALEQSCRGEVGTVCESADLPKISPFLPWRDAIKASTLHATISSRSSTVVKENGVQKVVTGTTYDYEIKDQSGNVIEQGEKSFGSSRQADATLSGMPAQFAWNP
jgi:hypothetical protein